MNFKDGEWRNKKGKIIPIHTMPDGHLNNARKYLRDNWPDHPKRQEILDEIKRRKKKRSK